MGKYTWDNFPALGTENYYSIGKGVLDTWADNFRAMDDDVSALPPTQLKAPAGPVDGYVPVYRSANDSFVWEDVSGVVGQDTYQVKLDAADVPGYLGEKIDLYQVELSTVQPTDTIIGSVFNLSAEMRNGITALNGYTLQFGDYAYKYAPYSGGLYRLSDVGGYEALATNTAGAALTKYTAMIVHDGTYLYAVYSTGNVYKYDPDTNTWTDLAPTGTPPAMTDAGSTYYACQYYQGKIYVIGFDECYDVAANTWVSSGRANITNVSGYMYSASDARTLATVILDGKIYWCSIANGHDGLYCYDIANDIAPYRCFSDAGLRFWGAFSVNGYILVYASPSGGAYIYIFDPITQRYVGPPLSLPYDQGSDMRISVYGASLGVLGYQSFSCPTNNIGQVLVRRPVA